MSTIRVDNFSPSAGGTAFGNIGIAKSGILVNQTGTQSVTRSFNVSSIIDNNTGETVANHNNDLAYAGYPGTASGAVFPAVTHQVTADIYELNATSWRFSICNSDGTNSNGLTDNPGANSVVFGDLA